ncbi:DnaJ C-terminal domain-containing protein [Pseudoroseomonas ludipueritiae]|uniref:J domain-containing protein n=1 Tax=Pseudoroseomonas ludipueritiae TaxID=198093 RepID=A0ABR7RA41_9PROT|nr:J domain-containing protein [Pseudoroseomonas ludipueritiae]MBC9178625.1 J domain-containing protein [Pseudoroseomonas ludipueritiae]MCG7361761.1 J domain-containing protein [Roseomonas sp. ACRSG]
MARDPYEALGVARGASESEIRSAYRKLAKRYHPDMNPGDKQAEERFKEASAAHALLSDAEKRARFDRGEIDAEGQERAPFGFGGFGGGRSSGTAGGAGFGNTAGFGGAEDFSDIFSELFGRSRTGGMGGESRRTRGQDQQYRLSIDFLDSIRGATRRLTLPDGRSLEVKVPAGIEDGQIMRLKGQGGPGFHGGAAGDALIEISVAPHPLFRREGDDIHVEVPVTLAEAVLGGKITVPTPTGHVSVTVPKHSDAGTRLRLRGKGVAARAGKPAGDEYVTLRLVTGPVDAALEQALRDWAERHAGFDARAALAES